MADKRKSGEKWWVVQHHDEMSVVQGAQRPDTAVEYGERMKHAHGPYASKDIADKKAQELNERTLKYQVEG